MSDELIEVAESHVLSREAAAARLRQLADQLARHNEIAFVQDGIRFSVTVPNEVRLKVEIEDRVRADLVTLPSHPAAPRCDVRGSPRRPRPRGATGSSE